MKSSLSESKIDSARKEKMVLVKNLMSYDMVGSPGFSTAWLKKNILNIDELSRKEKIKKLLDGYK